MKVPFLPPFPATPKSIKEQSKVQLSLAVFSKECNKNKGEKYRDKQYEWLEARSVWCPFSKCQSSLKNPRRKKQYAKTESILFMLSFHLNRKWYFTVLTSYNTINTDETGPHLQTSPWNTEEEKIFHFMGKNCHAVQSWLQNVYLLSFFSSHSRKS